MGEQLLKRNVDVTLDFTSVGFIELRDPRKMIELRFDDVAQAWQYHAALPAGHEDLGSEFQLAFQLEAPRHLRWAPEDFFFYVHRLFHDYHQKRQEMEVDILWEN